MQRIISLCLIILILATPISAESIHDLTYTNLDGNKTSYDKFQGRPLLVDTFATWCEPCKTEILNLMDMYESLSAELEVFTIDVSPGTDDINDIRTYRNDFGAPWEFGLDQEGQFTNIYATAVIPTLYLFNEDGALLETWVGVTDPNELMSDLEEILNVDFAEVNSNYFTRLSNQLLQNGLLKITASFMVISLFYILIVPTKEDLSIPKE